MSQSLTDLTTQCIRCGFCLESCPTFKITADETESPRGRIYLVRSAEEGKLDYLADVRPHLDACLGCRACETACPSGVEYGRIFEMARDRIEALEPRIPRKALLRGLTDYRLARTQIALGGLMPGGKVPGFVSRLLSGEPAQAQTPRPQDNSPWPPMDEFDLPKVRGEVVLLEGCVMRVLYPAVHEATRRLLRRVGFRVRRVEAGCCGAMHAHNGMLSEARELALKLKAALPPELPIIVNAAGCGSTIRDYAHLDPELAEVAERSCDASVFLHRHGLADKLRNAPGIDTMATYHDACHLAHGQGVTQEPRRLLEAVPRLRIVALLEADTCCGSAGIYNLTQPTMARALLERKWQNIESTGAQIVVSGNPGCHAWIEQGSRERGGSVRVLHTLELLEAAFSGFR